MGRVLVLNIEDLVVGPHLELIRRVCDPQSKSKPHVTVRYFGRLGVPDEYRDVRFDHLDVIGPDRFPMKEGWPNRAVFLRCELDSADLLWLEHKPDHPSSDFHITVYSGASDEFGRRLLEVLHEYSWGFRIELPNTRLAEVVLGVSSAAQPDRVMRFSSMLKHVFLDATSRELTQRHLSQLTDDERLQHVRLLCDHLDIARRSAGLVELAPEDSSIYIADVSSENEDSDTPVHLTPPELAREITQYAVDLLQPGDPPVDFGDPAVGTGVFYGALLTVVPRERVASAIGIDVNPRQVNAARRRWQRKGMDVRLGDYLHLADLPKRSLILANPPYLRHQEIPPSRKTSLRDKASAMTGIPVSGRAGLYVYFMLLSHEWMQPGAIAAWLVPSGFMDTDYGAALREYLATRVQLLRVHQYDSASPRFERVKVTPTVVIIRNEPPDPELTAVFSSGDSLVSPAEIRTERVERLRRLRSWNAIPRTDAHAPGACRIDELFVVRRGIATGANDFFIMERERAEQLGIPEEALRPVLPKVRALKSDVVEPEADGYPATSPQLVMIDSNRPEDEIARLYPEFHRYLSTAGPQVKDRTLVRSRHPWYSQENRQPPPFLCTYMGRGSQGGPPLRFVWNKTRAVATNTYLLLYPREPLARLLAARSDLEAEVFAILRRTAGDSRNWALREYAEGLRKVEPSALRAVLLAGCPQWLDSARAERLDFGD